MIVTDNPPITTSSNSQQTFSFVAFLGRCSWFTPTEWDIDDLVGGAANHTVRIRRRHGGHSTVVGIQVPTQVPTPTPTLCEHPSPLVSKEGTPGMRSHDREEIDYREILAQHDSVIMKQAPAYLAKAPTFGFSTYRQVVEAAALRLFAPSPAGPHEDGVGSQYSLQSVLRCNPKVRVPQLLAHDTQHNILIQSDLGALPSLHNVLVSSKMSETQAAELGDIIGRFLGDIHVTSASALSAAGVDVGASSGSMETFHNPDAERVMQMIIRQATVYMRDAHVPDAERLGERAMKHWLGRAKTVFGQGDLWFGTLPVDLKDDTFQLDEDGVSPEKEAHTVEVGVCDWEFAGPNHLAADIAQLGCYFHLLSLSIFTTPSIKQRIFAVAKRMYSTYFELVEPLWNHGTPGSKFKLKLEVDSAPDIHGDTEFIRSLLIMHGWEMINAAGWGVRQGMWCTCPGEGVRCVHIRSMVQVGASLLRAAGDGDEGAGSNCGVDYTVLEEIEWCRMFFGRCFALVGRR